jgi:hypothetical protein
MDSLPACRRKATAGPRRPRPVVLRDLTAAAEIAGDRLGKLLGSRGGMPTRSQLEGFAWVLEVPVEQLVAAARADGWAGR